MRNMRFPLFILLAAGLVFALQPEWVLANTQNAHYLKGQHLSKAGKWQEALPEFEAALASDPNDPLYNANVGVALSMVNRHKEALMAYDKALNLGYDNNWFRYNRGLSFTQLKLYDEAEKEYKKALEMDSRMVRVDYDLGVLYSFQGRYSDAEAQVSKLYNRNEALAKKLLDQIGIAYKTTPVENGGKISGRVILDGVVPAPRSFHLVRTPNIEFCSRMSDGTGHRIVYDFLVNDGGMADTVISIAGIDKGKPFSKDLYSFKINLCHAKDYLVGMHNGADFVIENLDPVKHEVATFEIKDKTYDHWKGNEHTLAAQKDHRAVLPKSTQARALFVNPVNNKEFVIHCTLHPFLQTNVYMVDNPYFAVSDAKGNYEIGDIPPGTYEITAWHPYLPVVKKQITIEPGKTAQLDFSFNSNDEKRKLYENDIQGYRFQPWYDSFKTFYGEARVDDAIEVLQKKLEDHKNVKTW